ncbi:hypothetical protein BC835DRAFT_1422929 [Cytidiella melzeri]|nr:hypothetical protein BC835DRAFT_1422929 [Cytidiella melzeri]
MDNKGNVIKLKELLPILNIRTHWDFAYHMLNQYLYLWDFFGISECRDKVELPSPTMLQVIEDVTEVLKVSHQMQQILSAEKMPVLSGTIPSIEIFMTAFKGMVKCHPTRSQILA